MPPTGGHWHEEPPHHEHPHPPGQPVVVVVAPPCHYPPVIYPIPPYYPVPVYHSWDPVLPWPYYPWHWYPPVAWVPVHPVVWHPAHFREDLINVRVNLHGNVPLQPSDHEVFSVQTRHYYGSPFVDVTLRVEQSRYTYAGQFHQLVPVVGWDHSHYVEFDLTAVGADLQQPAWADVTTYGANDPVTVEFDDADRPAGAQTYYEIEMRRLDPQGNPVSIIHGEVAATVDAHQTITVDAESPMHIAAKEWLTPGDRYEVDVVALRELPDGTRQLNDLSRAEFTFGGDGSADTSARAVTRLINFDKVFGVNGEDDAR